MNNYVRMHTYMWTHAHTRTCERILACVPMSVCVCMLDIGPAEPPGRLSARSGKHLAWLYGGELNDSNPSVKTLMTPLSSRSPEPYCLQLAVGSRRTCAAPTSGASEPRPVRGLSPGHKTKKALTRWRKFLFTKGCVVLEIKQYPCVDDSIYMLTPSCLLH